MESSIATPPSERGVDAPTIAEAFRRTVAAQPDAVALRTKDDGVSLTWSELEARVGALAGGLAGLGLRRGDTLAILLTNRPEFHVVDLAAMTLGATPFSIYQTYTAEQIAYVAGDAAARVIVCEQAFLAAVQAARASLAELEHVIVIDGDAPEGTLALAEVEAANPEFEAEPHWRAVTPEDILTLIYTSGTTGPPKGVQLAHRNLITAV